MQPYQLDRPPKVPAHSQRHLPLRRRQKHRGARTRLVEAAEAAIEDAQFILDHGARADADEGDEMDSQTAAPADPKKPQLDDSLQKGAASRGGDTPEMLITRAPPQNEASQTSTTGWKPSRRHGPWFAEPWRSYDSSDVAETEAQDEGMPSAGD